MNDVHQPQKMEKTPISAGLFVRENSPATGLTTRQNIHQKNVDDKEFFTLRARLSLVGHCLYQVKNDDHTTSFLVTKWGYTRELKTLNDVSKFLVQIGGQK
jgi:hypothetical protein